MVESAVPILVLLLLTTTIKTATVDAFGFSSRHLRERSAASRYSGALNFLDAKDEGSESVGASNKGGGSLTDNRVKKLKCIPTSKKFTRLKGIAFTCRQTIRRITERNTIYVLQLKDGKYYVGSTTNRKQRYRQHFENARGGSKWTRLHKPIRLVAEYKRIPSRYVMGMESQKTAEYMMKYGVNNVRGAAFCGAREFTMDDASNLVGFLGHYNQLDFDTLREELEKVLPRPIPKKQKPRNDKSNHHSTSNNIAIKKEGARRDNRKSTKRKKRNKKRQASTNTIVLKEDDEIEFHSNVMSSLREWLETPMPDADAPKETKSFLIPKCRTAIRKAVCQTIEKEHPDLVLKKQGRSIVRVLRLTEEQKEERKRRLLVEN
eukprot:CAMPEP_0197178848 /NCGR_PEP_ID=MMETSP1423-20130617/3993_1 /TAXON_ID=476441 /ORGANISM="Pseudo-nitzschia heimii, Strain UNC1101" /LENGTH=375 /DNA_ID=CAMNT_0042628661 /DNA_START=171 /DNA_END=1298 /DNA_ORIENTATION=+